MEKSKGYADGMCGRYALTANMDAIVEEYGANPAQELLPLNWNIAPTNPIYIIKESEQGEHHRQIDIASWGLIAPWERDPALARASQSRAINARSESVHEKPTFRDSFRQHRCLIPASGYYEWATTLGRYKSKQPFFISRADHHLISFAGIFSTWLSPHGREIQSAAIITRDAVGELATIHDRMPVMLPRAKWSEWLDPRNRDIQFLRGLLDFDEARGERPDQGIQAHPVSTRVNQVANNDSTIIEPIELGEPETLF